MRLGCLVAIGFARKVICRRLFGVLEFRGTWSSKEREKKAAFGRKLIGWFDIDFFDRSYSSSIIHLALFESWRESVIKVAFVARIHGSCKL